MGGMHASEFAEAVNRGDLGLEGALRWHLQSNHFPPIHTDFIPACLAAIEAFSEGDVMRNIEMCNGRTLPAWEIVNGLHLHPFLEQDESECDDCGEIADTTCGNCNNALCTSCASGHQVDGCTDEEV